MAVEQPDVDLFKPMTSLANLQMAQAHASLYNTQAKFQLMRQAAFGEAYKRKMAGDPKWYDPITIVDPAAAETAQKYDYTEREHGAAAAAAPKLRSGDFQGA